MRGNYLCKPIYRILIKGFIKELIAVAAEYSVQATTRLSMEMK